MTGFQLAVARLDPGSPVLAALRGWPGTASLGGNVPLQSLVFALGGASSERHSEQVVSSVWQGVAALPRGRLHAPIGRFVCSRALALEVVGLGTYASIPPSLHSLHRKDISIGQAKPYLESCIDDMASRMDVNPA